MLVTPRTHWAIESGKENLNVIPSVGGGIGMLDWVRKRVAVVITAFGVLIALQIATLAFAYAAFHQARDANSSAQDAASFSRDAAQDAASARSEANKAARDAATAACYARYSDREGVEALIQRMRCGPVTIPSQMPLNTD